MLQKARTSSMEYEDTISYEISKFEKEKEYEDTISYETERLNKS